MTKPFSAEQKSEWKKKIQNQQESHSSITSWCRQNNIDVHKFYYWKKKLFSNESFERGSFTELEDKIQTPAYQSTRQTILVDVQRIRFSIDPQVDNSNLQPLIKLLEEFIC